MDFYILLKKYCLHLEQERTQEFILRENEVVLIYHTRGRGSLVHDRPLSQASEQQTKQTNKHKNKRTKGGCLNPVTPHQRTRLISNNYFFKVLRF